MVKDTTHLENAFAISHDVLQDTIWGGNRPNFSDRGQPLSRSVRALKIWMSVQTFGMAAFRNAVQQGAGSGAPGRGLCPRKPTARSADNGVPRHPLLPRESARRGMQRRDARTGQSGRGWRRCSGTNWRSSRRPRSRGSLRYACASSTTPPRGTTCRRPSMRRRSSGKTRWRRPDRPAAVPVQAALPEPSASMPPVVGMTAARAMPPLPVMAMAPVRRVDRPPPAPEAEVEVSRADAVSATRAVRPEAQVPVTRGRLRASGTERHVRDGQVGAGAHPPAGRIGPVRPRRLQKPG